MNLPKKIKILSRDFVVEEMSEKEIGEGSYAGTCFCDKGIIKVSAEFSSQKQAAVLIHELLHAVWNEMGITSVSGHETIQITEEKVVTRLANGLAAVVRDNPALMPAIQKGLK